MALTATCPQNQGHTRFVTTAHVQVDWLVDESGTYLEDLGTLEVTAGPDPGNVWTCHACGAEAVVTTDA